MKNYHIPVFVPHKGCPHDCVFCNQRHITGHNDDVTADNVREIIEEHIKTMRSDSYKEVAFFGGSFTGIEISKQTELLKVAFEYVSRGFIDGIRCSTRPDYIDSQILENLKKYSVTCIELGVQSTDPLVLKRSRRGHSFEDVRRASELIKAFGISLGLQMMLGLPGDSRKKMIKTAEELISLKPDCVRIYPTLVVQDTALCTMYESGLYQPLSIEEAVDALSEIIPMFKRNNIDIIRVGLQTTDDINASTVKGPYHPAIRELAESRIIRKKLENSIDRRILQVYVHPSRISQTLGHGKCNKAYLKNIFDAELVVQSDITMDKDVLKINDKLVAIYS